MVISLFYQPSKASIRLRRRFIELFCSGQRLFNLSYQTLLSKETNYASFNTEQLKSFKKELSGAQMVFDPFSGYGTLTKVANSLGAGTFCTELNAPSYFWQYLCLPENKRNLLLCIDRISSIDFSKLEPPILSETGDDWITDLGIDIIDDIIIRSKHVTNELPIDEKTLSNCITSIILPFTSRVSTITNGDVKHVKKGGLAIYKNYGIDFKTFLIRIRDIINDIPIHDHEDNVLIQDDSRCSDFCGRDFDAMFTSPPYPISTIDYSKMFGPENFYLQHLTKTGLLDLNLIRGEVIGTNAVSGRNAGRIRCEKVNDFLQNILDLKLNTKSENDARSYYYPYYRNYFFNLQCAFENISNHLSDESKGLIIVRDNMWRKTVVPVSDFVQNFWREQGFDVTSNSIEVSHVGSKNPKVKGRGALHSEYTIKISR